MGHWLSVDLLKLIERVYISPTAPEWFSELVIKVTTRYGFQNEVIHSSLNQSPFF
jgi:hypothetical protein